MNNNDLYDWMGQNVMLKYFKFDLSSLTICEKIISVFELLTYDNLIYIVSVP